MPEEVNFQEVAKTLHEVFKNAFMTNCTLDEESVTQEELQTLQELDDLEVLENLKDLLSELLSFKTNHKRSDLAELTQRAQQFEAMIQKLEGEIQHQLKIHLEETQCKSDHFEKLNEKLIKEIEALKVYEHSRVYSVTPTRNIDFKLQNLDEIARINEKHKQELLKTSETSYKDSIKKRYEVKIQKLSEIAERRQKVMQKLEHECLRLRTQLEEKTTDYDKVKGEYDKIYKKAFNPKERRFERSDNTNRPDSRINDIDILRKKVDDKASELKEIQYCIKAKAIIKSPIPTRKYVKPEILRKSVGEMDWITKAESFGKKEGTPSPRKDDHQVLVKKRRYTASHYRSISDTVRPVSSRKQQ